MKRYALFSGDDYYPQGGMDDFDIDSDDLDTLKSLIIFSEDEKMKGVYWMKINLEYRTAGPDRWVSIWDMEKKEEVYSDSTSRQRSKLTQKNA